MDDPALGPFFTEVEIDHLVDEFALLTFAPPTSRLGKVLDVVLEEESEYEPVDLAYLSSSLMPELGDLNSGG